MITPDLPPLEPVIYPEAELVRIHHPRNKAVSPDPGESARLELERLLRDELLERLVQDKLKEVM